MVARLQPNIGRQVGADAALPRWRCVALGCGSSVFLVVDKNAYNCVGGDLEGVGGIITMPSSELKHHENKPHPCAAQKCDEKRKRQRALQVHDINNNLLRPDVPVLNNRAGSVPVVQHHAILATCGIAEAHRGKSTVRQARPCVPASQVVVRDGVGVAESAIGTRDSAEQGVGRQGENGGHLGQGEARALVIGNDDWRGLRFGGKNIA